MNVVHLLALLGCCCLSSGAVLPSGISRGNNQAFRRVARQIDPNTLMLMMLYGGDDMEFEFFDDFEENPLFMQSLLSNMNSGLLNNFPPFNLYPFFPGFPFSSGGTNECAYALLHSCPENSKCVDTTTGYDCECVDGFVKNGTNCQDVNECLFVDKPCHSNAVCENTEGNFTCSCAAGFTGDGTAFCSDVDECITEQNNCAENFDCINVSGSFLCICKPGFVISASGTACEDVDECRTSNGNCSPNAICTNNMGSFSCTCAENFFGDGRVCTAIPSSQ